MAATPAFVPAINAGSSSIQFAVYQAGRRLTPRAKDRLLVSPRFLAVSVRMIRVNHLNPRAQEIARPFGDDGEVTNESTREFLQNYIAEFHDFIARVYTELPRSS